MSAPTTPVEFIDEFLTGLIDEEEAAERAAKASNPRRLPAVEIVRKHLSSGMQQKEIAALYGVSAPAVSQLLKRAAAIAEAQPQDPAPKPSGAKQLAAEFAKLVKANPELTARDVKTALGVSDATVYRLAKLARVTLRNRWRQLPPDAVLRAEIQRDGHEAVAKRYDVSSANTRRHAKRLGVYVDRRGLARNRRLPADDVLVTEFSLFTPREIANRHGVSYQSVLEARVRLNVNARSARSPHATPPSGMTSIIACAIAQATRSS